MTVNVTSGPGIAAYESTRYTASVNAQTAWVAAQTHDMLVPSPHWTQATPIELSWVKWNGDETATVSITRIAGAITSAVVYPKNVATQVIVGGILILTVPTNTRLHIEVDNDRANAILVFSNPTARAIPAGAVYWDDVGVKSVAVDSGTDTFTSIGHGLVNGQRVGFRTDGTYPTASGGDLAPHTHYYVANVTTDTFQLERTVGGGVINLTSNGTGTRTVYITAWTSTTNALAFPLGEWHFGRLFGLADGVKIFLEPEAIIIGSFDLRGIGASGGSNPAVISGASIFGQGVHLGTFATHADLQPLPNFAAFLPYAMYLGYSATSGQVHWDNEVQGITIASIPFFANFEGVCEWTNVQAINPWFFGTLCPQPSSKSAAYPVGQMTNCYSYSGDDVLTLGEQVGGFFCVVQGCFLATANNSCLHFGYWSAPDAGTFCFVSQCDMMHLGIADNGPGSTTSPSFGGNSIMKCWTDGYEGEEAYGRFDVFVQDSKVWGTHASRLLTLLNKSYPYTFFGDESHDQKGQAARFLFKNITVESVPGQLSAIEGLDRINTPHDIAFRGVTFAGVPLVAENFSDYFTTNAYPYFLTVEGKPLVTTTDIANMALSHIGQKARVTSIAPPDGPEGEQCARWINHALNVLLESGEWDFNTKRVALTSAGATDNDQHAYRYQVPGDMLKAISVLPDGAEDDYSDGGVDNTRPFQIELDSAGARRIYTDVEDAVLRYHAYVTDPNAMPPTFQLAWSWQLAALIAGPIIRGSEGAAMAQRCAQMAASYGGRASTVDARQQKQDRQLSMAPWHRGR